MATILAPYNTMATIRWLQYYGYNTMATIRWLQYDGYNMMATIQWLQYDGYNTMATIRWLQYDGYNAYNELVQCAGAMSTMPTMQELQCLQ